MLEVGRLCVKIAGREAGKKCVVVDVVDDTYVLIDGQVKRRKCNIDHLEPLGDVLKIKKNASNADVKKEFKALGIEIVESKKKEKKEKPVKQRKIKKKEEKPKKEVKVKKIDKKK